MIPRIRVAHLPTPIEAMPRLSARLNGVKLLVKRDDLTGLALGGNKTRKLEYVLAEALANGAKTLITLGALQSNHCRQTAALAARYGLGCILVVSGKPDGEPSGNWLLDDLFGAELVHTTAEARSQTLETTFQRAWAEGKRPFIIPLGASTPVGSAGYFTAFEEMLQQVGGDRIDWIVTASSSGGTQAGLALGAKEHRFSGKVLGISIDRPAGELQEIVAELANGAAERLDLTVRLSPGEVLVNDSFLGGGYGVMGDLEREAIHLFARTEGLLLDPVYTGRAAGGLWTLAKQGFFMPGETVLFWHTGGTPALFADRYRADFA